MYLSAHIQGQHEDGFASGTAGVSIEVHRSAHVFRGSRGNIGGTKRQGREVPLSTLSQRFQNALNNNFGRRVLFQKLLLKIQLTNVTI